MTGRRKTSRKSTSPTMVEVAEAAKVSIFTVSAVVNGTSHVSDTLRARTESAIRAIGYKRNGVARSLKNRQDEDCRCLRRRHNQLILH